MPQNISDHPAVIIGAGLAGSALAILLSEAGRPYILLEKTRSAHHKVCGEFISWEAVHYLQKLGIDLPALGAHKITDCRLVYKNKTIQRALPAPAWSLSRKKLDQALIDRVSTSNSSQIRRGVTVKNLQHDDPHWRVDLSREKSLTADTIFLANGKHDIKTFRRAESAATEFIGFKMYFRLNAPMRDALAHHVEIILFEGGYAGLEPIEDDCANLCFLIHKEIYAQCGKNWSTLLDYLRQQSPHLTLRLDDAEALLESPLAIANIPYGYLYDQEQTNLSLFRLGDQAAVIHSFTGDGMSMALHSAFVAAQSYLAGQSASQYQDQICSQFSPSVKTAQWLARLMLSEPYKKFAFRFLRCFPFLLPVIFKATRLAHKVEQL
jgi:2-polyprenyl-6-methoxyphenol hydroxylase-like FAD-dependent oxidoreductase